MPSELTWLGINYKSFKMSEWKQMQTACLHVPSSKECRPTGVPVRPIDRANAAFDPDGGSDDPGPYQKHKKVSVNSYIYLHFTKLLGYEKNLIS